MRTWRTRAPVRLALFHLDDDHLMNAERRHACREMSRFPVPVGNRRALGLPVDGDRLLGTGQVELPQRPLAAFSSIILTPSSQISLPVRLSHFRVRTARRCFSA